MSVESTRVRTEVWAEWERRVVNGVFPLRRFLGGSSHSAVFLTEYKAENLPDAAIKLISADAVDSEAQLVQWGAAATLSHPHLIRLLDVGRCQFRGRAFLFVVMEYAEQTLAQILPKRALSPDEARELLLPTLDALAFLHRSYLAHSQLRPSNILVVNDRLKLASDTIRPIGVSTGVARASVYDPPELAEGRVSAAGDVWGLGVTLFEALTQRTPTWPDEESETPSFPATLRPPFDETLRRCLNRTPTNRPTVIELETQCKLAQQAEALPASQPNEVPRDVDPPKEIRQEPELVTAIAVAVVILACAWVGLRLYRPQPFAARSVPPPAVTAEAASGTEIADARTEVAASSAEAAPEPVAAAPAIAPTAIVARATAPAATMTRASATATPSAPAAGSSIPVAHQQIPTVPRNIRDRIRGTIKVTVRVLVDPSGNVVGEFFENAGPSRYFARVAGNTAAEWKFAPAEEQGSRVWLLRFEFTRGGAAVQVANAK